MEVSSWKLLVGASSWKLPAGSFQLEVFSNKLAVSFLLSAFRFELEFPAGGFQLEASGCQPPAASFQLQGSSCKFPTVSFQL